MDYLTGNASSFYLILEWFLAILALFVVPRHRLPTSGTAWLLVILLFPIPGWIAFLLLGNYKLPQVRQQIQQRINQDIDTHLESIKRTDRNAAAIIDPAIPQKYQTLEDLTQEYGRLPSLAANSIDIIDDYDKSIDSIVSDIQKAKVSIHLEYFALVLDDTTEKVFIAMEAARERGVDVKVLFDSWGTFRYPGRRRMLQRLQAADIPYYSMLPIRLPGKSYVRPDLRNHRKIVVVDNKVGYIGSQNMIDRRYHRRDGISYDEMVVRVTGPIVFELSTIFTTDWISEGGSDDPIPAIDDDNRYEFPGSVMQLLPSGPGFADENNLKVFTHLFHLARTSITIVNPYFVPPESLASALVSAARRGVKVRMINSKAIDQWMVGYAQRSFYDMLLEAGIELYLYHKPHLLHSKFIVVDDEIAVVGSSNMDMRSFELDSELSLVCYDQKIATDMERVADTYVSRSSRLDANEWQKRPVYQRFVENIARLTSSVQ